VENKESEKEKVTKESESFKVSKVFTSLLNIDYLYGFDRFDKKKRRQMENRMMRLAAKYVSLGGSKDRLLHEFGITSDNLDKWINNQKKSKKI
jgi:hypothetical protein